MKYSLLIYFVALTAWADWQSIPMSRYQLVDPPSKGSPSELDDLKKMHQLQAQRTAQDCEIGQSQVRDTFFNFFHNDISPETFAKVTDLMGRVTQYADDIAGDFKKKFPRARPFVVDETLRPCIDLPRPYTSYPSAHATAAATAACVLGKLLPDQADKLALSGDYYGRLRSICGVHFPYDVQQGQKLAAQICSELMNDAEFQKEFQAVKQKL